VHAASPAGKQTPSCHKTYIDAILLPSHRGNIDLASCIWEQGYSHRIVVCSRQLGRRLYIWPILLPWPTRLTFRSDDRIRGLVINDICNEQPAEEMVWLAKPLASYTDSNIESIPMIKSRLIRLPPTPVMVKRSFLPPVLKPTCLVIYDQTMIFGTTPNTQYIWKKKPFAAVDDDHYMFGNPHRWDV